MCDKDYTDGVEDLLQEWVSKARDYCARHGRAAKVKRLLHNIMSMVVIVLSVCAGSYTSMTMQEERPAPVVETLGQACVLALSILTSFHNFLKLEQSAGDHRESANRFQDLSNSIDLELSKARADRVYRAHAFLTIIQNRLEATSDKAPSIPMFA